jgi:hypothetical protein
LACSYFVYAVAVAVANVVATLSFGFGINGQQKTVGVKCRKDVVST